MKTKILKMGLAVVMSVTLLAGCGGGGNADGYKDDIKAFSALNSVDNTDFDAMSEAVEGLNVTTDEGKAIKETLQEVVDIGKQAMDAASNPESIDADTFTKMQEDLTTLTEETQTKLETFLKAAEDAGVKAEDLEGLDVGL